MNRTLVVYAWDGKSEPLSLVRADGKPAFDVLVFDYSGRTERASAGGWPVLSRATECKGEIYREVAAWLSGREAQYDYVGLIDDDIELGWSDINTLLAIAAEHRLDSFQAALSHDSHAAHARLKARPGAAVRPLPWVEVMMPFYRTALFMAGVPYYANAISSYGLDQFVMPTLQKLTGMERVGIVDAVVVRHGRPITSDGKVFRSGLTAHQERVMQWHAARRQVAEERPELVGSRWYLRTFSPLDGHHRFWTLRLLAPWMLLRRALRFGLGANRADPSG